MDTCSKNSREMGWAGVGRDGDGGGGDKGYKDLNFHCLLKSNRFPKLLFFRFGNRFVSVSCSCPFPELFAPD